MPRSYTADLPGGTATTTIQMQGKQRLRWFILTQTNAAAGKVELSRSSSSQIGTVQPTADVIMRANVSGTAGPAQNVAFPIDETVQPFESLYIHQTGAGNLGTAVLCS